MLANRSSDLMRLLRRMSAEPAEDAVLLARFAAGRDEAAFAELVRRHGPLVLGVCRRVAGHAEDAEDAFQAVFLVLARKAGTLSQPERLPAFLYGVAYRIARRARRGARRLRKREVQATGPPEPVSVPAADHADLWPLLDREVTALPEWYRQAVILCDLDGASRAEAARRLGIPEGTLSSRLNTGRKKLAARLAARGVTLSAVAAITPEMTAAAVPAMLLERATQIALTGAAGTTVATLALYGSGLMRWKLPMILAALATGATTAGMIWAMQAPPEPKPAPKPAPEVAKVSAENGPPVPGKPVLADAKDFPGNDASIYWSPNGAEFILGINQRTKGKQGVYYFARVQVQPDRQLKELSRFDRDVNDLYFGYSKDGKRLLIAKQESGLISSQPLWIEAKVNDMSDFISRPYDGTEMWGGILSSDGKSILFYYRPQDPKVEEAGIQLFDIATGTVGPVKIKVPSRFLGFAEAANGQRWVTIHGDDEGEASLLPVITMWDGDGKRLWSYDPGKPLDADAKKPRERFRGPHISADGSMVAVKLFNRPLTILAGKDGREGPKMERKNDVVELYGFSANGRLLAGMCAEYTIGDGRITPRGEQIVKSQNLVIWDTVTGKIVKSWSIPVSSTDSYLKRLSARFAPEKPWLIIAEPNVRTAETPQVRVGLWDLSSLVK